MQISLRPRLNMLERNKGHKKYRKVPKVTTLVTFGFSNLAAFFYR